MLAVVIWCLIHAIGSLRFDLRRALVLAICATAFLGTWGIVLVLRRRRVRAEASAEIGGWNLACVASFVLATVSAFLFTRLSLDTSDREARGELLVGSIAATVMMASVIIAIIGLSNPRRKRGRWLGAVIFVLLAVIVVDFFLYAIMAAP